MVVLYFNYTTSIKMKFIKIKKLKRILLSFLIVIYRLLASFIYSSNAPDILGFLGLGAYMSKR